MVVGRNNGVVGLTGFSDKKMSGLLFGPQKSGRNNGVVVLNGVVVWRGSTRTQCTKISGLKFPQQVARVEIHQDTKPRPVNADVVLLHPKRRPEICPSVLEYLEVVVSETLWQMGCAKWKAEENSATISTLVGFA